MTAIERLVERLEKNVVGIGFELQRIARVLDKIKALLGRLRKE